VADSYAEPRVLVGEVWLADRERFAHYLRPDEMHTAFNFDLMTQPWDAGAVRASIVRTLSLHARVGAPATWVLSNHDVTRPVTRYGRADTAFDITAPRTAVPTDPRLGRARARAAALLVGALPGVLYVYQGDELGLPEVEDLPPSARRDPIFTQTAGADLGRDGCRVPLPWAGEAPPYGFGPAGTARPWLPQPDHWAELTVATQERDPGSVLRLYRDMIAVRRNLLQGHEAPLRWLDAPAGRSC
jgi:alpha-glucosidase